MQFELPFDILRRRHPEEQWLLVGARPVRLRLVRNRRARRYVLRLRPDGTARVTVPRGGSEREAKRFAETHRSWLEQQLVRQAAQPAAPKTWSAGTEILFRGEPVRLQPYIDAEARLIRFGDQAVRVRDPAGDVRPEVERHLWRLAARELPARVLALAAPHGFTVNRVTVRNQRSRWGSCSRRGTVSLNWRLVQTPEYVRDYIVLHELAHLRQMNHSRRFWREVEALCPAFMEAERWLKKHPDLLR